MSINELTSAIIGAAIKVHRILGPGLLVNFHELVLMDGLKRIVNNDREEQKRRGRGERGVGTRKGTVQVRIPSRQKRHVGNCEK